MKISEIKDILKAEILVGQDQMDVRVSGAGGADLMADVLSAVAKGAVLLTGLTTEHVVRTARLADVSKVLDVPSADLETALKQEGFIIESSGARLSEIAQASGKQPMAALKTVLDAARK